MADESLKNRANKFANKLLKNRKIMNKNDPLFNKKKTEKMSKYYSGGGTVFTGRD